MSNTIAQDRLNGKIDEICEKFVSGDTYRQIAEFYCVSLGAFHNYISRDEHSARVKLALLMSADDYDDKAERVLKDAKSTMPEIVRAKELAQHYRRKAAVRNRFVYGEKIDHTFTPEPPRIMTDEQFQIQLEQLRKQKLIGCEVAPNPNTEDVEYEEVK